jgi:predicted HicB family RNase H-like nuclease
MILEHNGYLTKVTCRDDDRDTHGVVLNTAKDTRHSARQTIDELRTAFVDRIADHEDWCRKDGEEPENPTPEIFHCEFHPSDIERWLPLP